MAPPEKRSMSDSVSGCLIGADLAAAVRAAVDEVEAVDVHTHLFPGQHGSLLLWGIDDMLTYHYLVSEMFMVAPGDLTHEAFFSMTKTQQADLVWKHLFSERTPLSEAQLGVLTTLQKLGLVHELRRKDLPAIRAFFSSQDPLKHTDKVFQLAKLRYVIMTNIPFDATEAACWVRPDARINLVKQEFADADRVLSQTFCASRFKTALRIDPLLKGDWASICNSLAARGLPETIEGAKTFLRAWAKLYAPEYMMA